MMLNNEYLFGENILVRPVLSRKEDKENKINLYLPEDERWYNFYNNEELLFKGEIEYLISKETIGVIHNVAKENGGEINLDSELSA